MVGQVVETDKELNGIKFINVIPPAALENPHLPGIEDGGAYHARGQTSGPRYRLRTMLSSDPPSLRLAYMVRPLTEHDIAEFKKSFPVRFNESLDADSTRNTWQFLQGLAIWTYSLWGRKEADDAPYYENCRTLAEKVEQQFQSLHVVSFDGGNGAYSGYLDLAAARKRFQKNGPLWQSRTMLHPRAQVVGELHHVIGSAGYYLAQCELCERLFPRHDARQKFCSGVCRTYFNRKRYKELGKKVL